MVEQIRLQKYLAQCGICSRRKAEEHILHGRVKIDGKIIKKLGTRITPGVHRIHFNNREIRPESNSVYYLLNKPAGYITTLSDPQGRPVVTSLLKDVKERLFPVGRLDLDTEGALLLTNDGGLAQKIQHPKYHTKKTYEVLVKGHPSADRLRQLEKGILLEGKITAPARLRQLAEKGRNSLVEITIHEGRKRQVKKMFACIDHPVLQLKRTAYGKLALGNLPSGRYRQLNSSDLKKIFL